MWHESFSSFLREDLIIAECAAYPCLLRTESAEYVDDVLCLSKRHGKKKRHICMSIIHAHTQHIIYICIYIYIHITYIYNHPQKVQLTGV